MYRIGCDVTHDVCPSQLILHLADMTGSVWHYSVSAINNQMGLLSQLTMTLVNVHPTLGQ